MWSPVLIGCRFGNVQKLGQRLISAVLLYGPDDIGIFKLLWSLKEQRCLSFKEILSSPIGNFRQDYLFAEQGIRVDDNSPEDIKEVAIEMLDRLEGKLKYSEEDECLQEHFKTLMNPTHFSYGAMSRVAIANAPYTLLVQLLIFRTGRCRGWAEIFCVNMHLI